MHIYLPIAESSINIFLLIGLGAGIGFLSGMFGIGGGFLMTPLLIFIGIPPSVAVATESTQIAGSSFSGLIVHSRRRAVDFKMAMFLMAGGLGGTVAGVEIFRVLREIGQIDFFISLAYVVLLGIIGAMMLGETIRAILHPDSSVKKPERRLRRWLQNLPGKISFPASGQEMSIFPPIFLGLIVGLAAAIMGIGGGFFLIPAMIYLLGMPTKIVIGTSLVQITAVSTIATILHATQNQTVDFLLGMLLLIGGVIGAQIGARFSTRIAGDHLRGILAVFVLIVCGWISYGLIAPPQNMYSIQFIEFQ